MTRTENDLRKALRELERRADLAGTPPAADLLATTKQPAGAVASHRFPRWLPPLVAAAAVAAVAIVAVVLSTANSPSASPGPAAGRPHTSPSAARHAPSPSRAATQHRRTADTTTSDAAAILDDAAAKLDTEPWNAPGPNEFFYLRTTDATTWTSVSGSQPGDGRNDAGVKVWVPGCQHGRFVGGQVGACTLDDVSHYLADAPTTPPAWDAYLEHMAPGSRAADAQGKIIIQVLHEDLVSPQAAAALLRYTETCPGLHTLDVAPVSGEQLTGVTCTSMTNGSYGLVFDASSDAFVGFIGVTQSGQPDGPAEIILATGIVPAVGSTP